MVDIHYLQHTTSTNRVAYDLALEGEPKGLRLLLKLKVKVEDVWGRSGTRRREKDSTAR